MKSRALLVAALCAAVGICLIWLYMSRFEAQASGGQLVEVLMARQNLTLGEQVDPDVMLVSRFIPTDYIEQRQVRATDRDLIRGIRIIGGVRAGEILLWTDLAAGSDSARDLSGLVRSGMRAITIQADQSSSFGGLVRPGDRVDIFLTLDRPTLTGEDERVTVPLLQSLMVLAAGQDTGMPVRVEQGARRRAPPAMQNVTISATVEQSQMIAFARQRGSLTLVLRNPDDPTITEGLGETTIEDLVTIERRERVQSSRPRAAVPEAATSMAPVRIR